MAQRDLVFLTGATGFVGSHILRELLAQGYSVRALRRSPAVTLSASTAPVILSASAATVILSASAASSRRTELAPSTLSERSESKGAAPAENLTWIEGDLRNVGAFAHALRGCRYLIHCAALYSFAPRDRAAMRAVNVDATASLMMAAYLSGVERGVLTSSSATLGHVHSGYHRSKLEQEHAAFSSRLPITALLPTAPVGPGDAKPTPTGRLVLDFLRGKIVAKAPGHGGMNLVAVEDVARAHVAALERGNVGERYVVGGENLSMDEIWRLLAEITGKPMPSWRAPYALAFTAALVDEMRCRVTGGVPNVPLEGVQLSRERMYADSAPARLDLAYEPTPVREALERAVAWFRAYLTPAMDRGREDRG